MIINSGVIMSVMEEPDCIPMDDPPPDNIMVDMMSLKEATNSEVVEPAPVV